MRTKGSYQMGSIAKGMRTLTLECGCPSLNRRCHATGKRSEPMESWDIIDRLS